jgi:small conductance mechanosensitive channel
MSPLPAVFLMHVPLPSVDSVLEAAARIGLLIVVAFLVLRILFLLVGRVEVWMVRAQRGEDETKQRARTLGQIMRRLCTLLIVVLVVLRALGIMGWDLRPLLAGAGLLGVAVGFGAQTLVRDWIAGIFILAEDQFAVGDLIEVNGKAATVEALTMRMTRLRDFHGNLHFVPNGEMRIVTNRSRGWNRLAVDVPIAADQGLDRALDACRRVVESMNREPAWRDRLLDPIEVWGVEVLTSSEVQVRMVVRAKPGPDAPEAARELRRRLVANVRLAAPREIMIRQGPQAQLPGESSPPVGPA